MRIMTHTARLAGLSGLLLLAAIFLAGCSVQSFEEFQAAARRMSPPKSGCDTDTCFRNANYHAADILIANLMAQKVEKDEPILLTTFADVDDLGRSTTLGRIIPQQISSRLAQKGFTTIEINRITSYNVCYTKLLRMSSGATRSPWRVLASMAAAPSGEMTE